MGIVESLARTGATLYGVDPDVLKPLGGDGIFRGTAFACPKDGRGYALRFMKMPAGMLPAFEERLAFSAYLAEHHIHILQPQPTLEGQPYGRVAADGIDYTVILTPLPDGRHPIARNLYDWNEKLFSVWGQVVGKMHALAQRWPRWQKTSETHIPDWAAEGQSIRADCAEPKITAQLTALESEMADLKIGHLPLTRSSFGLAHNDLHQRNFFYNPDARSGPDLTLVDAGNAVYHWFITDIANALYHALLDVSMGGGTDRHDFAHRFLHAFLAGYTQVNDFDETWLMYLPLFLKYREIVVYAGLSREWQSERMPAWQSQMLAKLRRRILQKEPILPRL